METPCSHLLLSRPPGYSPERWCELSSIACTKLAEHELCVSLVANAPVEAGLTARIRRRVRIAYVLQMIAAVVDQLLVIDTNNPARNTLLWLLYLPLGEMAMVSGERA